jgi:hypothetical protein
MSDFMTSWWFLILMAGLLCFLVFLAVLILVVAIWSATRDRNSVPRSRDEDKWSPPAGD